MQEYIVLKGEAESDTRKLGEVLSGLKRKHPILGNYGNEVISGLEASYELLKEKKDEVIEELAAANTSLFEYFSSRRYKAYGRWWMREKDKKYISMFERLKGLDKSKTKEAVESVIKEILIDEETNPENSEIAYSIINDLRNAKGRTEDIGKPDYMRCGNYKFGKIVSDADEDILSHEIGHEALAKRISRYSAIKYRRHKKIGKFIRRVENTVDKAGNFFYKKNMRIPARILYKSASSLMNFENSLLSFDISHEAKEGFSEAFKNTLLNHENTEDEQRNLSEAWKGYYGKFSFEKYKEYYKKSKEYLKIGITEEKLNQCLKIFT